MTPLAVRGALPHGRPPLKSGGSGIVLVTLTPGCAAGTRAGPAKRAARRTEFFYPAASHVPVNWLAEKRPLVYHT